MQYQKEPGIYVYFKRNVYNDWKNCYNIKINVRYYPTLEHFFWLYNEYHIRNDIGYTIHDKKCCHVVERDYGRGWCKRRYVRHEYFCNKINCGEHDDKSTDMFVVYDEGGKQYTPDVLVGLRRSWSNDRKASKAYRNRYSTNRSGIKKSAWGGFRTMKTFQERKWVNAWNNEEHAPKARRARVGLLPDARDDYTRHADKSWKTQSKRKHQWKEK